MSKLLGLQVFVKKSNQKITVDVISFDPNATGGQESGNPTLEIKEELKTWGIKTNGITSQWWIYGELVPQSDSTQEKFVTVVDAESSVLVHLLSDEIGHNVRKLVEHFIGKSST